MRGKLIKQGNGSWRYELLLAEGRTLSQGGFRDHVSAKEALKLCAARVLYGGVVEQEAHRSIWERVALWLGAVGAVGGFLKFVLGFWW